MKVLFYIQFFLYLGVFTTCKAPQNPSSARNEKFVLDSISVSETFPPIDSAALNFDDYREEVVSEKLIRNNPSPKATTPTKIKILKVENTKIYNETKNEGRLVYKIPSEMKVRETYQIFVRIGKSSVNIYENLNGDVRETVIPVTQTMEVNLIDPSPKDSKSFDIVADNQAVQIVDSSESYTQWSWNVTPLKVGSTNLKVVVSIIRDGNKKEVVYQDRVQVKVNPIKQIAFWFNKYWQWLFTVLLIPIFKWLYDKYFKKEKE